LELCILFWGCLERRRRITSCKEGGRERGREGGREGGRYLEDGVFDLRQTSLEEGRLGGRG
jgi:hypothetical protein